MPRSHSLPPFNVLFSSCTPTCPLTFVNAGKLQVTSYCELRVVHFSLTSNSCSPLIFIASLGCRLRLICRINVPDQIGTLSQVGTKRSQKEAGPFKNFLSHVGTMHLSFRSQSH